MKIINESNPYPYGDNLDSARTSNELNHFTKRVSFHTLGCRLNRSETEVLIRIFRRNGFTVVKGGEKADICIINTCTVTENSDRKNRQVIRALNRLNPKSIIAVLGCYSQMDPKEIASIVGVNLIIGNEDKMHLLDYLDKVNYDSYPLIINSKINKEFFNVPIVPDYPTSKLNSKQLFSQNNTSISRYDRKFPYDSINIVGKQLHPADSNTLFTKFKRDKLEKDDNSQNLIRTRSSLKIQDGCDFMCSFCIIPFSRGRSRYRNFSDIIKEARMLVKEGIREIVITGVNVGTYRTEKYTIVNVIDFLNTLEGLDRIRISSIEPTTVPEILFQYMKDKQNKLVPFLHLPIQSGSDSILKKMKRRYSVSEYTDEIWRAYETVPDLCIGTDVMVGFPEENNIEFEKTFKLLENLPITYFHVFPFSTRKNTPANKIAGKIKSQVKQNRSDILRNLSSKKRISFNKRFLGFTRKVLFETKNKDDNYNGYTDNFIKVVLENSKGCNYQNKILPIQLFKLNGNTVLGKQKKN